MQLWTSTLSKKHKNLLDDSAFNNKASSLLKKILADTVKFAIEHGEETLAANLILCYLCSDYDTKMKMTTTVSEINYKHDLLKEAEAMEDGSLEKIEHLDHLKKQGFIF